MCLHFSLYCSHAANLRPANLQRGSALLSCCVRDTNLCLQMRATNEKMMERYIVVVGRELAKALKGLHDAGIMHRDVKGESQSWTDILLIMNSDELPAMRV